MHLAGQVISFTLSVAVTVGLLGRLTVVVPLAVACGGADPCWGLSAYSAAATAPGTLSSL